MSRQIRYDHRPLISALKREDILRQALFFDPLPYLGWFEERYPVAFEAFYLTGIHPTNARALIDPFTGKAVESFANVGSHSLAVAMLAARLVSRLKRIDVVSASEAKAIIERALIHDVAKPFELFRQRAFRAGLVNDTRFLSIEDVECGLKSISPSAEMIEYIAQAGSETGGDKIPHLLRSTNGLLSLVSAQMPNKIVHLSDGMTYSPYQAEAGPAMSTFLTCAERMVAAENPKRYPDMLTDGYVETSDGVVKLVLNIFEVPTDVLPLSNVLFGEIYTANLIAAELAILLGADRASEPAQFIKKIAHAAEPWEELDL